MLVLRREETWQEGSFLLETARVPGIDVMEKNGRVGSVTYKHYFGQQKLCL